MRRTTVSFTLWLTHSNGQNYKKKNDEESSNDGSRVHADARINAIRHYRCAGLSLAQIKEVFANTDKHEMIIEVLKARKKEMEKELAELEKSMAYLDKKINIHQERMNEEAAAKASLV